MEPASTSGAAQGILSLRSPYPFADTVQRLLAVFAEKRIKVFATIDQSAEALAAGLTMPPTTLVIFGNPAAGTQLMLANPESGIDLPLKALVYERAPGEVTVALISAVEIGRRYGLAPELVAGIAPAERLVAAVLGH